MALDLITSLICIVSFLMLIIRISRDRYNLTRELLRLKFLVSDLAKECGYKNKIIYNISDEDKQAIKNFFNKNERVYALKLLHEKYKMSLNEATVYVNYLKDLQYLK